LIIVLYFGVLLKYDFIRVVVILFFSLVGIAGSYGVCTLRYSSQYLRQFKNSVCEPGWPPLSHLAIPLKARMSIGMLLISVELLIMLCILLFIPRDYAGPCFIGFAIGESLGGNSSNCRRHLY
jgi:K(+)-stimulated pyrophosphate-energized sodium pump